VRDARIAAAYYIDKLGFDAPPFTYGDPPFFAEVKRNGVRLGLVVRDVQVFDPALRKRKDEELISASIFVSDAKPLFLEFQAAGATFYRTLRTEPWGNPRLHRRRPRRQPGLVRRLRGVVIQCSR